MTEPVDILPADLLPSSLSSSWAREPPRICARHRAHNGHEASEMSLRPATAGCSKGGLTWAYGGARLAGLEPATGCLEESLGIWWDLLGARSAPVLAAPESACVSTIAEL